MKFDFTKTILIAHDSILDNTQQNCVPHPNQPKEHLNTPNYIQDLNFKLLKTQANLRGKIFS